MKILNIAVDVLSIIVNLTIIMYILKGGKK